MWDTAASFSAFYCYFTVAFAQADKVRRPYAVNAETAVFCGFGAI